MERNTIGSFMAALRKANGLTQQDVADRLCVSNKTVSKWERNESAPDIGLIPIIAELFNVTSDELLVGKRLSDESVNSTTLAKVEKQISRLTNTIKGSLINSALIAVTLSILGFVLVIMASYTFEFPALGTGLYAILLIIGMAVLAISVNNNLRRLDSGASYTGTEIIDTIRANIWVFCFGTIIVLLFIFFLALPLNIARYPWAIYSDSRTLDYVALKPIDPENYLRYIPLMILLWLISLVPVYLVLSSKLSGCKTRIFRTVENNKKMGFLHIVLFFCLFAIEIISGKVTMPCYVDIVRYSSLALAVVVTVMYIIKTKSNRLLITVAGIRNVLLFLPALYAVYGLKSISFSEQFFGGYRFTFRYVVSTSIGRGDGSLRMLLFAVLVLLIYAIIKLRYLKKGLKDDKTSISL